MGLIRWSEETIRKLSLWDFAVVKMVLILFGMLIGAYISDFVKQYVWYFAGVFVVLYGILIYKIFMKKEVG
jgi:putative Mn2+ efflux pump MntP